MPLQQYMHTHGWIPTEELIEELNKIQPAIPRLNTSFFDNSITIPLALVLCVYCLTERFYISYVCNFKEISQAKRLIKINLARFCEMETPHMM